MTDNKTDFEILKLVGNKVNAKVMTLLRRHPMGPRDLSQYLNKKEGDIVRRLKRMERAGLITGSWGNRLGETVKLYSLAIRDINIKVHQEGLSIELKNTTKEHVTTDSTIREGANISGITANVNSSIIDFQGEENYKAVSSHEIIGRDYELKALQDEQIPFFFIAGMAGIGKTSLVKKFVEERREQNKKPDTQGSLLVFWHRFKEIDTLSFLMGRMSIFFSRNNVNDLVRYLDTQSSNSSSFASAHDSTILDIAIYSFDKVNNCLLIFDDYHKVRDEKISIFLRQLQQHFHNQDKYAYSKNKVIVLSRLKPSFFLDNINSRELILSGLSLAEAKEMASTFATTEIDEPNILKIWNKFRGHPMALKLYWLSAREKNKDDDYLLPKNSLSTRNLQLYLQKEILEILEDEEINILLTMSVFRTPVKVYALKDKGISIRGGLRRRNLNHILHSLEKKVLINRTNDKELILHDLLRESLYSMLAYPEETHAYAAQYHLSERTTESLVESIYHLTKCHNTNKILEILEDEVINEKYRFVEEGYAAPLIDILGQISISNIGRNKLLYLYLVEGKALSMLERWEEAKERLEEALKTANNISDDLLMGYTLRGLSESLYLKGDFAAVEKNLTEAALIFQRYPDKKKFLYSIYMKLARLCFATGRPEQSVSYLGMVKSIDTSAI
jgi:ATP/maltotriose-dependent transcriptional regulator MalT/DNA-binding transcriptional ArsR family regulator